MIAISRAYAMKYWEEFYGNATEVEDFAGRKMIKSDYNSSYNEECAWVIARKGPTSTYGNWDRPNLVCCHKKTDEEKGSDFPLFRANGKTFEVIKVQGKPVIREKVEAYVDNSPEDMTRVNFWEAKSGIKFFKGLTKIQAEPRFVGTILVRIISRENTGIVDFVEKFYERENISYSLGTDPERSETRVVAKAYNLPLRNDTQLLLNKCMVLNTYMQKYFLRRGIVSSYELYYRLDYYEEKTEMYLQSQKLSAYNFELAHDENEPLQNCLYLSRNVVENTSAGEVLTISPDCEYSEYTGVFEYLGNELEKIGRKENVMK